jgi:putative DNA primase/helicase
MPVDFAALAARLLSQSKVLLPQWLPAGKWRGPEYVVGNLAGDAGDSLSINSNSGKWADFASGEAGGDLISLYAAIHGIKQSEAARQLDDGRDENLPKREIPAGDKTVDRKRAVVILPVPETATPCECRHYKYGMPVATWAYRDEDGRLLGHVARYEPKGEGKQIVPWTYSRRADRKPEWRMGQWPEPRPLYGLEHLAAKPGKPVLVVEGEKACDAARELVGDIYVVVTWPGGSNAWRKARWSALAGRRVLLWPDNDLQVADVRSARKWHVAEGDLLPAAAQPGYHCMDGIGRSLVEICPEVKIIVPDGQVDGWDAADAVAEGWTWGRFREWARERVRLVTVDDNNGVNNDGNVEQTHGGSSAPAADRGAGEADRGAENGPGSHRKGDRADVGTREPDRRGGQGNLQSRGGRQAPARSKPQEADYPISQVSKWLGWGLTRSGNGLPVANLDNAVRVLECDPSLAGHVWFDDFLRRLLTGDPAREWTDADDANLTLYMQREIGIARMGREAVSQAVMVMAFRDVRHCVRDWLDTLAWDGVPRIDHFFTDHFGADQSDYTMAASRNFWIAMAARAFKPGCKVDNVVVLEGAQGRRKSTALAVIGGSWYSEQHESATNPKAFAEVLQGKLLIEISEMESFSRAEVNRVKQITSCQYDRFRPSYGRHAIDHPRQCVMVCTTNRDDWNKDETGARRFWPIRCRGDINIEAIQAAREQLFAEAAARFKQGESWWIMPDAATRAEQRKRYDADPWLEPISGWLTGRTEVTANDILTDCLRLEIGKISRADQMRVASCLRVLGWINGGNSRRAGAVVKLWRQAQDE